MSDWRGARLTLRLDGGSHEPSVSMRLAGFPADFAPDFAALQAFLNRRRPGRGAHTSARHEDDNVIWHSGLTDGRTDGSPLCAEILNTDVRKQDYVNQPPRPSHADYPAYVKYGAIPSGGGAFSGRMTAPLCIVGGLCLQWLAARGIAVHAHILQIGDVRDAAFDPLAPRAPLTADGLTVLDAAVAEKMRAAIIAAKADGDSLGGEIECTVTGLPVGIGEPLFGGLEGRLASILFAVPAVKGVHFGAPCAVRGSAYNDPFYSDADGVIRTKTNHVGGILGGLSDGMPLLFRAAIKPTPSIARPQETVSLPDGENIMLTISGRHDPCIVPRAVPCIEAAAALALTDAILEEKGCVRHGK